MEAASNKGDGKDIMELVLGDNLQLRWKALIAGSKNQGNGRETMALQLDQLDSEVKITEDIPTAVADNWACGGKDIEPTSVPKR